jgi:Ca-activated chloride channel family protein
MAKKFGFSALFALALLAFLGADALADGFIVLRRPRRIQRRPIPLAVKYHHVDVEINEQVAVTKIDQVFVNPNPMQLEGEYIFPLPPGSSVTDFSMYMAGKEVHGEILEANKARQIYESIVRRLRDPALLEYLGLKMFRARVFPIPARGETRIKLTYIEQLESTAGQVSYRYPLNTEKFSSRPLQSVSVNVVIRSKERIKVVDCPSHNAEVVQKGGNLVKVAYENKNVKPDKDFVLSYTVSSKDFGINLSTFKRLGDGFFRIVLSPDSDLSGDKVQKKVVVFVVDTSLSMVHDDKIGQMKKALEYCVRSLRPGDAFNIVDFSTEARQFHEELVKVTDETLGFAAEYIGKMRARGGTAIDEALKMAQALQNPSDKRPFLVVFMTDGRPTWGVRDPNEILKLFKGRKKGNVRLFGLGIGDDVDTLFLDRLALQNGGAREYVVPGEDLEVKVSHFFDKVAYPVLTDLRISVKGMRIYDVYPKPLGDLFKGAQVVLHGRYEGTGARAVELRGRMNGTEVRYVYEGTFNGKSPGGDFVPRLWAQAGIAHMLEEIRLRGENNELKQEIIRLSKKYGIMDNKYVSYLVVEDEGKRLDRLRRGGPMAGRPAPAGGPTPTPTPTPSGQAFGGDKPKAEAEKLREAADDMESDSKAGVTASRSIKALKKGFKAGDVGTSKGAVRKIMVDKTFYRSGKFWIDGDYDVDKDKLEEVVFMSDAYFALLKAHPHINKYLSVGNNLIVKMGDKVYRIVDSGK